ncbi:ZIP family metal transporter [Gayadomonas joobiniege]|uniref:ZIP family metal transporter n=1 Tax=Gayadomonas joobiniege TaxID=1234606 RepID=UPI00036CB756|nr:hypothetical protein [Gayadomonas joobiniege]
MNELIQILIYTSLAGICIPFGGWLASIEHLQPKWLEDELRHFIIALGGGILVGAVAFVLVPEGHHKMPHPMLTPGLILAGGGVFLLLERYLANHQAAAPQLIGTLLDYLPEAVALGGLIALHAPTALTVAILIGLQNLPEGFNAYRELLAVNHKKKTTLIWMCGLALLGPICGLLGFYVLADFPVILGVLMLVASGGILYLIFQDIAPQIKLNHHWLPGLGGVFGFCIAFLAKILTHT